MFKKPYENDKGQKSIKEERPQRINYLEKLDSPPPEENAGCGHCPRTGASYEREKDY